jgi:hypothetical protein
MRQGDCVYLGPFHQRNLRLFCIGRCSGQFLANVKKAWFFLGDENGGPKKPCCCSQGLIAFNLAQTGAARLARYPAALPYLGHIPGQVPRGQQPQTALRDDLKVDTHNGTTRHGGHAQSLTPSPTAYIEDLLPE